MMMVQPSSHNTSEMSKRDSTASPLCNYIHMIGPADYSARLKLILKSQRWTFQNRAAAQILHFHFTAEVIGLEDEDTVCNCSLLIWLVPSLFDLWYFHIKYEQRFSPTFSVFVFQTQKCIETLVISCFVYLFIDACFCLRPATRRWNVKIHI